MTTIPLTPQPDPASPPVRTDRFAWERQLRADPGVTGNQMLTLLTLGTYMNGDGSGAHPGAPRLAREVGLGESTVRRHLTVSTAHGWLTLVRRGHRRGDGVTVASEYAATVAALVADDPAAAGISTAHPEAPDGVSTAHRAAPVDGVEPAEPRGGTVCGPPGTPEPVGAPVSTARDGERLSATGLDAAPFSTAHPGERRTNENGSLPLISTVSTAHSLSTHQARTPGDNYKEISQEEDQQGGQATDDRSAPNGDRSSSRANGKADLADIAVQLARDTYPATIDRQQGLRIIGAIFTNGRESVGNKAAYLRRTMENDRTIRRLLSPNVSSNLRAQANGDMIDRWSADVSAVDDGDRLGDPTRDICAEHPTVPPAPDGTCPSCPPISPQTHEQGPFGAGPPDGEDWGSTGFLGGLRAVPNPGGWAGAPSGEMAPACGRCDSNRMTTNLDTGAVARCLQCNPRAMKTSA